MNSAVRSLAEHQAPAESLATGLLSTSGSDHSSNLLSVLASVGEFPALVLLDCGATHSFVSSAWARLNNIELRATEPLFVTMADGVTRNTCTTQTSLLTVSVGGCVFDHSFSVLDVDGYDVILGMPWFREHNPQIDFQTHRVSLAGKAFFANDLRLPRKSQRPALSFISGKRASKELRSGSQCFLAWVEVLEGINSAADQTAHFTKEQQQQLTNVLEEFHDCFPDQLPEGLPPERAINHEIEVESSSTPPSRPPFRLPKPQLDELQRQLEELLRLGYIQPSKSPYGAPVFFVKKSDGSLRLVCDWRQLNKITVKNKACLPSIEDLFDSVQGSKYFTKLDLASGYHQVRIREGDVHKTAINTPFGHFEYRVMGFGLTNAPATFMSLMNHVLQPFLRKCAVVFLDDILIYSQSWKEHLLHIRSVLSCLRSHKLFCKPKKCVFGVRQVTYLGHHITGTTLAADPEKLKAVSDWPTPKSVSDIRRFLGFANYFRRFIKGYSDMSRPLEETTGRHARFVWNQQHQEAFDRLKACLQTTPVLQLVSHKKPLRVVTDASAFALAGVLLQETSPGTWHPVAYTSRRLTPAERNYTAMERETLAVVHALVTWRTYLYKHFDIITDNNGVTYLKSKKALSQREARWVDFLADFDFSIHHVRGQDNIADPLSRRPDMELRAEFSLQLDQQCLKVISSGYASDKSMQVIIKRLGRKNRDAFHERYVWDDQNQLLYLRDDTSLRLCVPQCSARLLFLGEYHDCVTAAHPGRDRTYARLSRHLYWPGMSKDVKKYVASCEVCQRAKSGRFQNGLLQPLSIPLRPWEDISMDLITGLPATADGNDAVFTFVDRLTKCVHLVPVKSTIDAEGAAKVYINTVFKLHGLSRSIVCDRDPRFTARFFTEVFRLLGTKLCMSTANHPQSDGMTERIHRVVGDILRAFTNHQQNNWDELLPFCEFAINDRKQESTGETPFYLNYGQHPHTASDLLFQNIGAAENTCNWLQERSDALKCARDAIAAAQVRQTVHADSSRRDVEFRVGDLVMVHRDFLVTAEARDRPSNKLRLRWYGPFKVVQLIGPNAVKLDLPHTIRAHPVFNVSALKLHVQNTFPGRDEVPPAPVTDRDGHTRYFVQEVLSHRTRGNSLQFLVKWCGYQDATWEPEVYLQNEIGEDLLPLREYKRKRQLY